MRNIQAIFISAAFVLFLTIPQLGALLNIRGEGENLQNRTLKKFPEISIEALSSISFGEETNEYVWDHLPLRTQLIEADHWIDYFLFKDSPVPDQVLLGKDNWLFLYPSVMTWPRENAAHVKQFVRLAQKATRLQEKTGVKILIVPSPSKASIYPEFLTGYYRKEYTRYASVYENRLEKAAAAGAKSLLLLWEPFRNEKIRLLREKSCSKTQQSTCYLYRPKDRHFDWETAIFQAKQIVERLAPDKWDDRLHDQHISSYRSRQSEMGKRFIRVNLPEPYVDLRTGDFLHSNAIQSKTIPVEDTNRNVKMFTASTQSGIIPVPERVVIIHDSFIEKSKWLLAPYFKETIFMHWSMSTNFSFLMETVGKADILIIQGVDDSWYFTNRLTRLQEILNTLQSMKRPVSSTTL